MKRTKTSNNGTQNVPAADPLLWDMTCDDAAGELDGITTPEGTDPVLQLIQHLKNDPSLLRNPDIQEQLRLRGKSRLDRYLLTQQMERAGLSAPRELWHILDTSEHTITPRLTFSEAKQFADDEGDARLVEDLLVLRGFSILGADAKVGKSTLVKNLMWAVLKGESWLGRQVMQGAVLFYLLEQCGEANYVARTL